MRRFAFIGAALLFLAAGLFAQDVAQDKDDSTRLTLQVLNESSKNPVADAHVIIRFTETRMLRRDKRTSWEAKTNRKGVVVLDGIPRGAVKVQVIAKGYQTYGNERELSKPEEEFTVLIHPPQGQVSAY